MPANILVEGSTRTRVEAPPSFRRSRRRLCDGGAVSTVIENLLLRKQKLVEQLEKAPSVEDRDKIEHQLDQINTALDFLDRQPPKEQR